MSTANPSSGSFATYAREALGPWAGYTIGWLYWFFWVIVIAVEAIAGSTIIQYWFPSLPSWGVSLILTFLLTLTNLYSVKSFGEFEYWFSLIKVVSLVLFLLLGGAIILGLIPGVESPGHRTFFIEEDSFQTESAPSFRSGDCDVFFYGNRNCRNSGWRIGSA